MNIFKLTISSLALMIMLIDNGLCNESDFPVGVKINANGDMVTERALIGLATPSGTSIRYSSYGASGMTNILNRSISYAGGGCMQSDTGGFFDASIDLPNGARIISASFEVIDDNASENSNGRIISFDGEGNFITLFEDSTINADTPGAVSLGGFFDFTLTINTAIIGRLSTSGTGTEVCGVRVGFIPPSIANDVIFVSNFYR